MSNVINLVSESVFSEKMDAQNAFLAAIAANTGNPVVNSWADVQVLVRAGLADKVFSVGDILICSRNGTAVAWDIVGIDCDIPTDKNFTHSLTLQTHKSFTVMAFDTAGSNEWRTSSLREWLNNSQNGFVSGLDSDFTAVLGAVDKITAVHDETDSSVMVADISSDLFFIPSRTEYFGTQTFGVAEGVRYPYYTGNNDRIKYKDNSSQILLYYSRSAAFVSGGSAPSTNRIYLVNGQTGSETTIAVPGYYGVAPACCVV